MKIRCKSSWLNSSPIRPAKPFRLMVADSPCEVIPKSAREKAVNILNIFTVARALKAIMGTINNPMLTMFWGSRSCIQSLAISSDFLSGFVFGTLLLSRIISSPFFLLLISISYSAISMEPIEKVNEPIREINNISFRMTLEMSQTRNTTGIRWYGISRKSRRSDKQEWKRGKPHGSRAGALPADQDSDYGKSKIQERRLYIPLFVRDSVAPYVRKTGLSGKFYGDEPEKSCKDYCCPCSGPVLYDRMVHVEIYHVAFPSPINKTRPKKVFSEVVSLSTL